MKTCTNCGKQSYRVESKFCLGCGANIADIPADAPHINICTNVDCDYHRTQFIYPDDARFCDICGTSTAYAK